MVISLFVFVLLGAPPIWLRLVERIVLIPVIAALSYEVLRLGQRFDERGIFRRIYRPNIWLQALTTRDPDDAQIGGGLAPRARHRPGQGDGVSHRSRTSRCVRRGAPAAADALPVARAESPRRAPGMTVRCSGFSPGRVAVTGRFRTL